MKERILQVMENEGLAPSKFAETIGIQRSAMSHIISGRNNPSLDVFMKILETFPYINSDWLLFGKGEMQKEKTEKISFSQPDLFTNTAVNRPIPQVDPEYRKENEVKTPLYSPKEIVREEIKYVEVPAKKITEIRIFFDNGTYETFKPEN